MKRKTRTVFAAVSVILLCGMRYLFVTTVPVYPDFQRKANSFEEMQNALSGENIPVLPDAELISLSRPEYANIVDGRSLLAKNVGVVVSGRKKHEAADISYVFRVEQFGEMTLEGQYNYKGVPIRISKFGSDTNHTLSVVFLLNGYLYTLRGTYQLGENAAEIKNIVDRYLQEHMLEVCQNVIDKAELQ